MTQPLAPIGQGRYAFLLFDSTFKTVLCTPENEGLLIQIIELLVPGKHISSITFTNKEKHGLVISEKVVNFDMLCTDADTGEEFLVEVQNAPQNSFQDRVLSYSTYPIREQLAVRLASLRDGERLDRMDYSLKPIYVISLVNFILNHESEAALEEDYICRYELRNRHNAELMTPALNFVFVEMGRMRVRPEDKDQCNTLLEKFIFSLKYMHMLKDRPEGFEDKLLKDLYRATELASMSIETREYYDHNMRTELDYIAEKEFARQVALAEGAEQGKAEGLAKGRAEGQAKGRAEGQAQAKAEIAKAMLSQGLSVDVVVACTGLSEKEIDNLK